jgi:DNA adenine methylase
VEPFVGGGSVAIKLLQDESVQEVILMDIDPWIADFWKVVFFHTDWIVEQIETTDISLEKWKFLKEGHQSTMYEKAWAGFYLNRTSFSGILEKKVGPLGGKYQLSENKIDCRFPRATLIDRIVKIAAFKEKVKAVWCITWDAGIRRINQKQLIGDLPVNNVFYYFDPPFFEKADNLYRYYFRNRDHNHLRDYLLTLKDKWLLSYDSADQVFNLYGEALQRCLNGARHEKIELLYSLSIMAKRRKAKEIILTNLDKLPKQN